MQNRFLQAFLFGPHFTYLDIFVCNVTLYCMYTSTLLLFFSFKKNLKLNNEIRNKVESEARDKS